MPSAHKRIAVPRDPELESALRAAAPKLDPKERRSAARQVRALALIGARTLAADEIERQTTFDHALAALGARRPTRSWDAVGEPIEAADLGATPATDALQWARGER